MPSVFINFCYMCITDKHIIIHILYIYIYTHYIYIYTHYMCVYSISMTLPQTNSKWIKNINMKPELK